MLLLKATKARDKTVIKREWFDLSNHGDIQRILGHDEELIPKLCECDLCAYHQNQFEFFKAFITEKFPEFVSLRYFLYYYFTKS